MLASMMAEYPLDLKTRQNAIRIYQKLDDLSKNAEENLSQYGGFKRTSIKICIKISNFFSYINFFSKSFWVNPFNIKASDSLYQFTHKELDNA